MFKKLLVGVLALTVLAAAVASIVQFNQQSSALAAQPAGLTAALTDQSGRGYGGGQPAAPAAPAGTAGGGNAAQTFGNDPTHALLPAASELTQAEADSLLFMIEEEKMAHDVYVTLYAQWGLPVFQTISQSEAQHVSSIQTLLDRYGLTSPVSAEVGVFTNPELQALYSQLIAQGSQSLADALKVGAAIEEIDILDLQERLAATDNADIQQVYASLMSGSGSHLNAFVTNLFSQTGETYQPQYMTVEAYQASLAAAGGNRYGSGNSGAGASTGGRGRHGQGGAAQP